MSKSSSSSSTKKDENFSFLFFFLSPFSPVARCSFRFFLRFLGFGNLGDYWTQTKKREKNKRIKNSSSLLYTRTTTTTPSTKSAFPTTDTSEEEEDEEEEEREKKKMFALGSTSRASSVVVSPRTTATSSSKRRSDVKCSASSSSPSSRRRSDKTNFNVEQHKQTRREVMKFAALAPALFSALPAMAILQGNDEDDEAFLAKAKANRSAKLQNERSKQAKYAGEKLGRSTGGVAALQLAVYKISKAGSLIDQDSIYGAGAELESGNWEKELGKSEFGTDALISAVGALKQACASGDANGAKQAYVSTANALKQVANAGGVASQLKFL